MSRIILLLLGIGFSQYLSAQEPTFARYIKVTAADSQLSIKETVKSQLLKEIEGKKKQTAGSRLRLVLTGDKESNSSTGRWLAARQTKDLYVIELSAVVSKYIGETEKNLALLFDRAEGMNCILLFDEADALFGQRTESDEDKEKRAALTYFLERMSKYKGAVLISCSGTDCLATFGKNKFTGIKE
ncbi:MAG: AAA family ATPase [Chitinophagales bacterium]|nr:AAA family ATPase [Chitinophagales bacterium]